MLAPRDTCKPCSSKSSGSVLCARAHVCVMNPAARFHISADNVLHQLSKYMCLSEDTACVRRACCVLLGLSFFAWATTGTATAGPDSVSSACRLFIVLNRHYQPSARAINRLSTLFLLFFLTCPHPQLSRIYHSECNRQTKNCRSETSLQGLDNIEKKAHQ